MQMICPGDRRLTAQHLAPLRQLLLKLMAQLRGRGGVANAMARFDPEPEPERPTEGESDEPAGGIRIPFAHDSDDANEPSSRSVN